MTDRTNSYMIVRIGDKEFSSISGQIKMHPQPYIAWRTHQFSEAAFVLVDPDDEYRAQISKETDVEIEVGFVGGESQDLFSGKVWSWTRIPPDGTRIEVVDKSAAMAETGSGVSLSSGIDTAPQQSEEDIESGPIQPDAPVPGESDEVNPEPALVDTLEGLIQAVSTVISGGLLSKPTLDLALKYGLDFEDKGSSDPSNLGDVHALQSGLSAVTQSANRVGDVLVDQGDRLVRVKAGEGEESGIVLNYGGNPGAFVRRPSVMKRSGIQLSQAGITTFQGWSVNDKTIVGASVVTPGYVPAHPTGTIQVPDWGGLNLGESIIPNGIYTWNDATKNGTRVPTKAIMERIAAIAVHVEQLTDKAGKGKWTVTSWYRDPVSNRNVGGASQSRHLSGDAVDVFFPGFEALHRELDSSWPGGLAAKPGSRGFLHLDARHEVGDGRSRWTY